MMNVIFTLSRDTRIRFDKKYLNFSRPFMPMSLNSGINLNPVLKKKTVIFKHVGQKVKNIGSSKDAK